MAHTNAISSHAPALSSVAGTTGTGRTHASTEASEVRKTAAPAKLSSAAPATQTADRASVSSTGGLIAQALNANSSSDVRTEKVAALQTSIANGTYNVPAAAVAGKLIDHLLG